MPSTNKPLISLKLFQLTDLYNLIASIDWLTLPLAYKSLALTYIDWLISHFSENLGGRQARGNRDEEDPDEGSAKRLGGDGKQPESLPSTNQCDQ